MRGAFAGGGGEGRGVGEAEGAEFEVEELRPVLEPDGLGAEVFVGEPRGVARGLVGIGEDVVDPPTSRPMNAIAADVTRNEGSA